MKRYRVTGFSITLGNGVIKLTEQQASIRRTSLEPVDETAGVYEITRPIQFKRGEVIGYAEELPKTHLEELEELDEKRPRRTKAEVEADRIAELEAKGEDITPEEAEELAALKAPKTEKPTNGKKQPKGGKG